MMSFIDITNRQPTLNEIDEITDLIAPSFQSCNGLIVAEWARCTGLYRATDSDGRLESIFFVAWEPIRLANEAIQSVYLGLSATREDAKNSGSVRNLYRRFVEDAQAWEAERSQRLVLWYTSATPSSCLAAKTIFAEAEPHSDGSYTDKYSAVLSAIRTQLHVSSELECHPFVLKGYYKNRRYSIAERSRISAICQKTGFSLLRDLGVDEMNGDRLVYICRVPRQS